MEHLSCVGLFETIEKPWWGNKDVPASSAIDLQADSCFIVPADNDWRLSSKARGGRVRRRGRSLRDATTQPAALLSVDQEPVVAVIDSGIDTRHPLFDSSLWQNPFEQVDGLDNDGNGLVDDVTGWNFVDNNPDFNDESGHGTQVAGLVAQVAGSARIMPLKVFGNVAANPSHIASAIDYATQKRVDVINLSMNSGEQSSLVDAAIGRALALGIHIVVSAGNSGASEPEYPANLPGVIAAGELNASGRLQPWSSGPGSSGSQYVATQVKGMKTAYLGGRTVSALGTSSAAAKITGILASLRMNAASQWMSALRDLASTPRLRRR